MEFGSLFSGHGGMDLGLERAGWQVKWQVENNPYAQRVLKKHWPGLRRAGDVREFFPDESWRVDAIVGGDPCQRNSNASSVWKRQGGADCGAEFVRIVAALRPLIVLRENPTVESPAAAWPWRRMRDSFAGLGYCVLPFRVRACCVGADHRRDRLFLLATLPDADSERLAGIDWQGESSRDVRGIRSHSRTTAWHGLPQPLSYRGRSGLPGYVERVTGLGNAVYPDAAKFIGRRILAPTPYPEGQT